MMEFEELVEFASRFRLPYPESFANVYIEKYQRFIDYFESDEFSVVVGIASTTNVYIRCLKNDKMLQELKNLVDNEYYKFHVKCWLERCVGEGRFADPNFVHPKEAAICAYMYALKDQIKIDDELKQWFNWYKNLPKVSFWYNLLPWPRRLAKKLLSPE